MLLYVCFLVWYVCLNVSMYICVYMYVCMLCKIDFNAFNYNVYS